MILQNLQFLKVPDRYLSFTFYLSFTSFIFSTFSSPQLFINDLSQAVALLWFYVVCFGVRVSVTFYLMCVYIIFVWFGLLSGHLLGKTCSLG